MLRLWKSKGDKFVKLLIVEDEKVLSKALAKGLGKLGYAPVTGKRLWHFMR